MLNSLNKNNKNIQFTIELQIESKINHFDLTISTFNNEFTLNIRNKDESIQLSQKVLTIYFFLSIFQVSYFNPLLYVLYKIYVYIYI